MRIKKSDFVTSAVKKNQYPIDNRAEIAFVGRSNVGKSSIINALTNRNKLAKVSQTPGKTRLINFFIINDDFYLVDLPGYGYAKVSKSEKESWGKTIETYLTSREQLKRVVLLVDSRHKPTGDDILMYKWIKHFGYDVIIVATKSDKLSRNELKKNEKIIKETLELTSEDKLYFFSSVSKDGRDQLIDNLFLEFATDID
ncbi:ribosome biogenesis GTP-binding protein YihA/YsxC [Clostridium saccharoperbutylacetonicum]|uniref:Probable GTP-binding protein EngB n=1 Tax=Clostridium saccharoperbutylacetonicum N1-4(HMT) TaxID=931276 RepID=M1MBM0_9CLOT|nr:ribosome biogenesis GTP-binding protein YihA/YsxC [Clostridium saccharoperbutylacetonicum]AGF55319.1 ribosome biogenesis GTP-binding protein YsxC/EngB [Clostridium saccharoperbutylacetonicum N1-4(HMT)]AQR94205.1 putative GTP-binding protein EngB [Clostridium saccharoperbutylacetonicum]NRT63968.1 GTP-binding protein [Clostridium saccharoperbutylacetonicum]NSB27335.1 GTP-binding protein [Clostridium saccharoperbutylacetonicum]NSB29905.1 GTP-binding protein [Clostridium saccharoperbutylacetoni